MEDNEWNKWKPVFDVTITFHVCSECLDCHWIQLDGSVGRCEKCDGDTKHQILNRFENYIAYRTSLHQWRIGRSEEEIDEAVEQQRMAIQMEVL